MMGYKLPCEMVFSVFHNLYFGGHDFVLETK